MRLLYPIKALNSLNKAYYYKVIFFTFLLLTLVSTSKAETITGSPAELINGNGTFTWTSQNFPALKSGDILTIRVVNNTIEKFHTENYNAVLGINYYMKSISMKDLLSEQFPSAELRLSEDDALSRCVNFLTEYYCTFGEKDRSQSYYNRVIIDKKPYQVHAGDKFSFDNRAMEFSISGRINSPSNAYILVDSYSGYGGGYYLFKGQLQPYFGFPGTSNTRLFVYVNEIHNDYADIQGFVEKFSEDIIKSGSSSKLMMCGQCSGTDNGRTGDDITNKDDIILVDGTNYVTDELKIVKNGNSIYLSANIVKRTLNLNYIPAPTPPLTPTITPTVTPIITLTPASTVPVYDRAKQFFNSSPTPALTVTPSVTSTITLTPTPTSPSQLEQEVKELKERLNKTEEKQSQQESRISWLESAINSILDRLKSFF